MARTLRIVTGIVLFVFVATHLLNMSIGLVSLDALEAARLYFMMPWSNPVGFVVLQGAMVIHGVLGLVAIYWRNTLRMTRYDAVQTISALLIIPLLASHVLGVTLAANLLGFDPSYQSTLTVFWVNAPLEGLRQVLVVAVTWIHGCAGLFTWMRLNSWWPKVSIFAYPLAVFIPVAALLGFVEAGNEVVAIAAETTRQPMSEEEAARFGELFAFYTMVKWSVIGGYLAMVAAVLVARQVRIFRSETGIVTLSYLTGDALRAEGGPTLLELAEANDIPHANICKGRGRCGTCRVRIVASDVDLPAPSDIERKTLARFHSADNVRLACQLAPASGKIELERIVPPDAGLEELIPDRAVGRLIEGMPTEPAS